MSNTRLKKMYQEKIRPTLMKDLSLSNIMQVPVIKKIVLNVGSKEAVANSKVLQDITKALESISGQRAVKREARKSIAGFKLREGMPIGAMVTLRGANMYTFLDRLINVALPQVRDFQGISRRCDGRGNYNLGIKEISIFPEIVDFELVKKIPGLNITIQTSAASDAAAVALLEQFGMPFKAAKAA